MKFANRINEKLGHRVGCEMGRKRPKMGSFGETVHDNHDDGGALGVGEAGNEIQSQMRAGALRCDVERLGSAISRSQPPLENHTL